MLTARGGRHDNNSFDKLRFKIGRRCLIEAVKKWLIQVVARLKPRRCDFRRDRRFVRFGDAKHNAFIITEC